MFHCNINIDLEVDGQSIPFFPGSYYELLERNVDGMNTTITDIDDAAILRIISMNPLDFIDKTRFLMGNATGLAARLHDLAGVIETPMSNTAMWRCLIASKFDTALMDRLGPAIDWVSVVNELCNPEYHPDYELYARVICRQYPHILHHLFARNASTWVHKSQDWGTAKFEPYKYRGEAIRFIDLVIDKRMVDFNALAMTEVKGTKFQCTPLMIALKYQYVSAVKLMAVTDIDIRSEDGSTALSALCENKRYTSEFNAAIHAISPIDKILVDRPVYSSTELQKWLLKFPLAAVSPLMIKRYNEIRTSRDPFLYLTCNCFSCGCDPQNAFTNHPKICTKLIGKCHGMECVSKAIDAFDKHPEHVSFCDANGKDALTYICSFCNTSWSDAVRWDELAVRIIEAVPINMTVDTFVKVFPTDERKKRFVKTYTKLFYWFYPDRLLDIASVANPTR